MLSLSPSKTQNAHFPCVIPLHLKKVSYKVSLCECCQRQSCKDSLSYLSLVLVSPSWLDDRRPSCHCDCIALYITWDVLDSCFFLFGCSFAPFLTYSKFKRPDKPTEHVDMGIVLHGHCVAFNGWSVYGCVIYSVLLPAKLCWVGSVNLIRYVPSRFWLRVKAILGVSHPPGTDGPGKPQRRAEKAGVNCLLWKIQWYLCSTGNAFGQVEKLCSTKYNEWDSDERTVFLKDSHSASGNASQVLWKMREDAMLLMKRLYVCCIIILLALN